MADDDIKKTDLNDLVNKTIPQEVLEQLRVLNRVEFVRQPTRASAVSTAGTEPDDQTKQDNTDVSGVLDHVGEMENLAAQIEDMIDDLTKDMQIPVPEDNDALKTAVQSLDPAGDGSNITKDVFDKAVALIDHAPILMNGYDPVTAALTGDGSITGDFVDCDAVTRSIANTWSTKSPEEYSAEQPIGDDSAKIADEHEKNLEKIIIEILQMFFFNMLWPKYLVDLGIINPTRVLIAYPLDGVICFFKSMCGTRRFKMKSKDCLKENGPINKALNEIRCFLLCIPPRTLWSPKKYKPIVDMPEDCDCTKFKTCPEETTKEANIKEDDEKLGKLGNMMDALFPDDAESCTDMSDFETNIPNAEGVGVPPECLKHAKLIMEAVIADALTPQDPTQTGLTGTVAEGQIIRDQTAGL